MGSTYSIQMKHRNASNTDWDNLLPITAASNVLIGDVATSVDTAIKTLSLLPELFGAIGDGNSHPLSTRYSSLAQAQTMAYPFATSLTQEIDYCAIQAALNKITGGQILQLTGKYIVDSTLILSKLGFTIKGSRSTDTWNNSGDNDFTIKYTGSDTLFKSSGDIYWGGFVLFEDINLYGNANALIAIDMNGPKFKTNRVTIAKFNNGTGIRFKHGDITLGWTGETHLLFTVIHDCKQAISIIKNGSGTTYDSFMTNCVIYNCDNWVNADALGGWVITGSHFYGALTTATGARFIANNVHGCIISNNYIEFDTTLDDIFDLGVNPRSTQISNNYFFYQGFTLSKTVSCIKLNGDCSSLTIQNNTLECETTNSYLYLVRINSTTACYVRIFNNDINKANLYTSNRTQSSYEIKICEYTDHFGVSTGIRLNAYDNTKTLVIDSVRNWNDALSKDKKGLYFNTQSQEFYYYNGTELSFIDTLKEVLDVIPINGWSKKSNRVNQIIKNAKEITINFHLNGGNILDGTVIFVLAQETRPLVDIEIPVWFDDNGKKLATVYITASNGNVVIYGVTNNTDLAGGITYYLY